MCIARNPNFLTRLVVGIIGVMVLGLTAQAQIFTGSISFVGGANIDLAVPNATTVTSFYGPGGSSTDPVVQGGSQSGAYASVPGGTPATFSAPFTFNPAPGSPFQLWNFTVGATTYSFDVTSVDNDTQSVLPGGLNYLNIGGSGVGHITGYSDTPEVWSITGTTANGGSLTVTMGNSVNAVPEPGVLGLLLIGGLLLGGRMIVKGRQKMCRVKA